MRRRPAPKRVQPAAKIRPGSPAPVQSAHHEVCRGLGDLFEKGMLTDVTISVQGRPIRAHAAILAAGSPVFAAMFTNGMRESTRREVEISDQDVDVMQALVRFMYTGEVHSEVLENDEMTLALMLAAHKYEAPTLVGFCSDAVSAHLQVKTVAERLLVADSIGQDDLRVRCLDFISGHLAQVQATPGYDHLVESRPALLRDILATVCPPVARTGAADVAESLVENIESDFPQN